MAISPVETKSSRQKVRIALLFAALFLFLTTPFQFIGGMTSSSEAREAHIASLMISTGDWILPPRNGILPSKPPLYHWITAGIGKLAGGVSVGVARVTSGVAAAGTLFLTIILSLWLYGKRGAGSAREAWWVGSITGIVLVTTYGFTILAFRSMVDMTLACAVVGAFLCGVRAGIDQDSRFRIGIWLSMGAAVLAKGPIAGIALPGFLIVVAVGTSVGWGRALWIFARPQLGWLLLPLIVCPWYILASGRGEGEFLGRQIVFENLLRLVGGENVNREPWWFYIKSTLTYGAPWSIFALCSIFAGIRTEGSLYQRVHRGLAYSFFGGVVLFSLASGKRHSYLLPLFPLLAAYSAQMTWLWFRALSKIGRSKVAELFRYTVVSLLLLLALAAVGAGSLVLFPFSSPIFTAGLKQGLLAWAVITALFAALLGAIRYRSHLNRAIPVRLLTLFLVLLVSISSVISISSLVRSEAKSEGALATQIELALPVGAKLYTVRDVRDEFFDVIFYYLPRQSEILPPTLSSLPSDGVILAKTEWLNSRPDIRDSSRVIQSFRFPMDLQSGERSREFVLLSPDK